VKSTVLLTAFAPKVKLE